MKHMVKRSAGALALALFIFTTTACIPNFTILSPAVMDVGKRIKQAVKESKQAEGIQAKAKVFAKAYCDLRAEHPKTIEKIRNRLELVIPTLAVKATRAVIDKGCGKLTSTGSHWTWRAPGMNLGAGGARALAGAL